MKHEAPDQLIHGAVADEGHPGAQHVDDGAFHEDGDRLGHSEGGQFQFRLGQAGDSGTHNRVGDAHHQPTERQRIPEVEDIPLAQFCGNHWPGSLSQVIKLTSEQDSAGDGVNFVAGLQVLQKKCPRHCRFLYLYLYLKS